MTSNLGIYDQEKLSFEIEKRKKEGIKWPGEVNQKLFAREEYVPQIPEFAHFLDVETISCVLEKNGFCIDWIDSFTFKEIPDFYRTNGKEYICLEATKL